MPQVSAVLFDYGLVLSAAQDAASWARMQSVLHAEDPAFHDAYWRHRADYDDGTLSGQAFWRSVALDLTRPLNAADLAELLDADTAMWTQPNTAMIAWAAALQRAGVRTGILSNMGDCIEQSIRERCPWLSDFAHHTFSHAVGFSKPDARIYMHAATGIGVPPRETLFVDDRTENVAGALDAGMHAIQFVSNAQFAAALVAQGYDGLLAVAPFNTQP